MATSNMQEFVAAVAAMSSREQQNKLQNARKREREMEVRVQNGAGPEIITLYQNKRKFRMALEAAIKLSHRTPKNQGMRKKQPNYTLHG